jgi:hypothetical protein
VTAAGVTADNFATVPIRLSSAPLPPRPALLRAGAKDAALTNDPFTPPAGQAEWHPKLQALHRAWSAQSPGPGLLPGRQHVGPEILKPWLPVIWLLDVLYDEYDTGDQPRIRYRLAGTKLIEMRGGHNPMGLWLEDSNPSRVSPNPTISRVHGMLASRQPSWRRGMPNNRRIDAVKTVENLFLPLAADGATVDMILCASLYFGIAGREL